MPKGYIIFEANGDTRRISDSLREFLLDEFPDRSLSSAFDILGFKDWRAFPSSLRGDSLPNRFFGEERGPIYEGSCSKFDDIADLCIADLEWACEEGESDLQFFTTISHELRAPLNGIIGFASLMEQTELNEEQRTILQKLQTSNFLLKGLINDLLEFSRVRSAKIELVEEEVDLELFLSELIGLFSERAKSRGIELVIDLNCEKAMRPFFPKLRVA
ncbi:MAG: histidine kinase dimerization/phospho-acceptor domain-containing protein, partial [Verrucomicrobiota bacterium]